MQPYNIIYYAMLYLQAANKENLRYTSAKLGILNVADDVKLVGMAIHASSGLVLIQCKTWH